MKNKQDSGTGKIIISAIIAGLLVGGAMLFSGRGGDSGSSGNNITIADGKQVIEISAKGGYQPRNTAAKAGMPTTLKVKTNNTFDCSLALMIPDIGFQRNLPPTGETLIEVPPQQKGTKLNGLCSMGMYYFSITFN